jgi:putative hydrolase of the HAD superfamily
VTRSTSISAVFWDFGGVILSSPFEAFNRFEREAGLPLDTIRGINATNPNTNAWARFERSDITAAEFDREFAVEAAARGHDIGGARVLSLLRGDVRPEMVRALDIVKAAGYATACLTNNMSSHDSPGTSSDGDEHPHHDIMSRFDAVVESSKVGVRKPEPRFYEIACELVGVTPNQCVFLDDLGVNLKPAAAMGMTTIKVLSAHQALSDLEACLGITLM